MTVYNYVQGLADRRWYYAPASAGNDRWIGPFITRNVAVRHSRAVVHWKPDERIAALCGQLAPVAYAEIELELVTCRVCMYHLGTYVPLAKLVRHQIYMAVNFRDDLLKGRHEYLDRKYLRELSVLATKY